jgi:DNA modification methylase
MTKAKPKAGIRDRIKRFDRVRAADLLANPLNWRQHPEQQKAAMAGILNEVGMVDALLVRENGDGTYEIIDGHMRAGMMPDEEIPVLVLDLTPEEATKVLLTFDPISGLAEANAANLNELLKDVEFSDAALQALVSGLYDDACLADMEAAAADPAEIVEDEVPEPPVEPITKPGDLWILGNHRLLCGDSTKAEDVARLMAGAKAEAVITDPPYGVSYVGKTADALPVHNDGKDTLLPLLQHSLSLAAANCNEGGIWYVAAPPGPQFYDFATVLRDLGIWRQTIVWAKQSLVMGHSDYHYQHEAIFYGWKPGKSHQAPPDRKQTTLWQYDRPTASREHPTMKPVLLFAKMFENSTSIKSLAYEPFCGSGTTLIAAEQLNRKCYGMEISPQYCDVIVKRWENLTGQKATLEA